MANQSILATKRRTSGGVISTPQAQSRQEFFLEAGRRLRLKQENEVMSIVCLKGRVRLIHSHDRRSYMLAEGESFVLNRAGEINLRALGDASIGFSDQADGWLGVA